MPYFAETFFVATTSTPVPGTGHPGKYHDFSLGNIRSSLHGYYIQDSTPNTYRAGNNAGGVGHFFPGIGFTVGAGVSGDGLNFLPLHLYGQRAAQRTTDAG